MQSIHQNNQIKLQKHYIFLGLAWIIIQSVALFQYGIVTRGEAEKYIGEVAFLKQHHYFSQPKYLFYSVYIAIHYFFDWIGAGNLGVYIFQLVLNGLSMVAFYKLISTLFKKEGMAFLITLLLIVCFPWQLWTTHLYTEMVFLSLVIIFTYYLLKPEKSKWDIILTCIFLLLVIFSRPTGLLFVPALLLWYIAKSANRTNWWKAVIASGLGIISFVFVLNYEMKGEGEFDFMKPFIEEHIICGVPGTENKSLHLPADGNSMSGLMYYASHNPLHFTKLAFRKIVAFFGLTRSYYSAGHNLLLILFFYPLYLLVIAGMPSMFRLHRATTVYLCSAIAVFAISVAFTCDDWLNRFIMPVIPFLVLLSTPMISKLKMRIEERKG